MKQALTAFFSLIVGVGLGLTWQSKSARSDPMFVTEGEVYDGQVELLSKFVEGILARDAKACADLYTSDTVYMIPQQPSLEGYDAVLNDYQALLAGESNSEIEMAEPVHEVLSMGDYAVIRGSGYNIETKDDSTKKMTYKWVILSKRQTDGSWKMLWDIFNYDADYNDVAVQ